MTELKEDTTVCEIKKYIEAHLEDEITLDKIAEKMNYSKFHLSRLFAEKTGKTIYQHIKLRRLEEAANKLENTDKAIVEIAYESGYHSQQAFTQAFTKVYEYPPLEYRRRYSFRAMQQKNNKKAVYMWKVKGSVFSERRMAA